MNKLITAFTFTLLAARSAFAADAPDIVLQRYKLNDAEIATLLANSIHYDVAEVVDPHINVVAKIGKDVLAQLPRQ